MFKGVVPGAETETPGIQAPAVGPDAGIRVPPGALLQYYSDLSSGLLPPEDMRIEDLQYRVQIDPTGQIVTQSEKVTLIARYIFAFRRMSGFILDGDLAGFGPGLVNFQVQEQGRDINVFKRPVSMQSLLSRSGSGNIAEWDGVYTTVPGTDLAVNWTVDSARWTALVGATKEMGIQILGDYVVCRGNY
jgi:hypothetical protein